MQDFPQKTFFNKPIPKAKFYEKLPVTQAIKNCFVNEIEKIIWRNKLSPETLNVQEGKVVQEIEVIEIVLRQESLKDNVLKIIDNGIPYPILFMLHYGEKVKLCCSYKINGVSNKEYYSSDWYDEKNLILSLNGLTIDEIYDNLIRQLHGNLQDNNSGDLSADILEVKEQEKLQKRIAQLEKKLLIEKQFKKQMAIRAELLELKNHEKHE